MSDSKNLFPRFIQPEIERQTQYKNIVVVTGMRRVGKTTLLKMVFNKIKDKNKVFLDLDNIIDQQVFEESDFNHIWSNLKQYGISSQSRAYVFLDEVQLRPAIIKAVKYLYDHYDIKFFLTGSSSFYLKNLFPESLSGRKVIFELYPLDFREFLVFKGQNKPSLTDFPCIEKERNKVSFSKYEKLFEEYCSFGGFPQVVLEENEDQKRRYLGDILSSYIDKDIRQLADFRNLQAMKELMFLLFPRIGSRLEITKIASELKITRETVYSYLSFLESTYFLSRITPFSKNVDREISGTKKIYFCDNGLLNLFGKVSEGSLLENAVFLNLRKYGNLCYYQRRSGREIDFLIPGKGIGFEVKRKGTEHDVKILKQISSELELRESYVISKVFNDLPGLILAQDL
jgi:predicted AAA+ superfamily ATPase